MPFGSKPPLQPVEIARLAHEAGWRGPVSDSSHIVIAVAVCRQESLFHPEAYNGSPPDASYGLWQINMYGRLGPDRRRYYGLKRNEDLYDPRLNAKVAFDLYRQRRARGQVGFEDWGAYTHPKGDPAYRKHLPIARAAVAELYSSMEQEPPAPKPEPKPAPPKPAPKERPTMKLIDYGKCYNGTGRSCSGRAQPGTRALRDALDDLFPALGDLGIYNCRPTRGGGSLSTHGEGRGWDAACNAHTREGLALGNKVADLLVKYHRYLGVQRIIWNRRQWDVNSQAWRAYRGTSPHTDHLHIELCWAAAAGAKALTIDYVKFVLQGREDPFMALTDAEQKALAKAAKDAAEASAAARTLGHAIKNLSDNTQLAQTLARIEQRLTAIEQKLG